MVNYRHLRRLERLKRDFERLGIHPRTRMGQNFLLDKNQVNYIAAQAGLEARDVVLEVGPGTGFLTQILAASGCRVLAVELDRKLVELARRAVIEFPNVSFMQADILAGKNRINPEVTQRLLEIHAAHGQDAPLKVVSNLPYSAGTPFVANLFGSRLPWTRAVFLLQYEVARRLVAAPATRDYGSLAIIATLGGRARLERKVPPQVFWPRPKVASAVVRVDFLPPRERGVIDWPALRRVCVAAFNSRRKTMRNALKRLLPEETLQRLAAEEGLDFSRRGMEFTPAEFLVLGRELARAR